MCGWTRRGEEEESPAISLRTEIENQQGPVSEALHRYADDPESIPRRNIERLEEVGWKGVEEKLSGCDSRTLQNPHRER